MSESGRSKTSQITVKKATVANIRSLSKKLLELLKDKRSEIYRENVAKFGIPEDYVKKAFSEEELVASAASGKSTFYLAFQEKQDILGFAQIIHQDNNSVELDRIIVFPQNARKGIGTQLLTKIIKDRQRKGTKTIMVNTGKDEYQARQFYEKNGFKPTKETSRETPWGTKLTLVTYELKLATAP